MLTESQKMVREALPYVHSILLLHTGDTNTLIQEHLQKVIPWPVKSGKCEDVSAAAIEEFFRKAPPKETSAKKMVGLIKMECLKWHTDRSPRMFGMIEDKVLASLFNIVAQVVIKIRAELGRR